LLVQRHNSPYVGALLVGGIFAALVFWRIENSSSHLASPVLLKQIATWATVSTTS
jgi:hypothetical protein